MNEATTIHSVHKDKSRHRHFFLLLIPSIVFVLTLTLLVRDKWKSPVSVSEVVPMTLEKKNIALGNTNISVSLAKTPDEHAKGLSGVSQLPENTGMLFVFPGKARPAFWMKDMIIPLDMIWIADGKVSQITKDIKAPAFGTPDSKLTLYIPNDLINYVLEVNAGFSEKNNIKVGDTVDLGNL